jgi:arginine repressor
MAQRTEDKIHEALATGNYFKSNGDVHKTLLAKSLNMTRATLDKYLKSIAI